MHPVPMGRNNGTRGGDTPPPLENPVKEEAHTEDNMLYISHWISLKGLLWPHLRWLNKTGKQQNSVRKLFFLTFLEEKQVLFFHHSKTI